MYVAAVLMYLIALAAIGIWRTRGAAQTSDDFLVAGRSLPASVLVFTLLSTWIGSGSLFAGAGLGYRVGLPALWQSAGAWFGIAVIFFLAPRVRRLAHYTVPDILERRYGSTARVLGAVTIVLAYTAIAAYQFRGGGRLLNLVAGLDPATGASITAAFCVLFTAAAGMRSIAFLDVINGLTMLGGIGIAVVYLLGRAGGAAAALASVRPDQLTIFGAMSPVQAVALFLPTMCLLLGEANMYQKFFSARDERAARLAVAGWIAGTIVVESMIVGIGLLGSVEIPGLGIVESETIVCGSRAACCRRSSARCCLPRAPRSSCRQRTACCSARQPTWSATSISDFCGPRPHRERSSWRPAWPSRSSARWGSSRGVSFRRSCQWLSGPTRCMAPASRRR